MAEYQSLNMDYQLNIDNKYYSTLDIESFSLMMKDPSYCYKFYWLEAIVKLIDEGITETTFNDIIDEMIANAWYSVTEFHIHLSGMQNGAVRDGLERAVLRLAEVSQLPANASKVEIKNEIANHALELKPFKEQLTNMVPYRALAGFIRKGKAGSKTDGKAGDKAGGKADGKIGDNAGSKADGRADINWGSVTRMVEYIDRLNRDILLPYTLGTGSRLKKEVYFQPAWISMIRDNSVSILGWIQYEKTKWLQMNNPEVPGLVYKLAPLDDKMRKLSNVRKLWQGILEIEPVRDVFTGKPIERSKYDVDHFIPWSFVMNDELWNLMPMDPSLNGAKSNHLPKWNPFFAAFANNQFRMYELMQGLPQIRKLYESCYRDNLHSLWAGQELYRPGNGRTEFVNILEKNMRPVYDSAKRQGYEYWDF